MGKDILRFLITLLAMTSIAACVGSLPELSTLPTASPSPTPVLYEVYTSTLDLPDGRALPVECVIAKYGMGETRCRATFPNGNIMDDVNPSDFDYSPDGEFAVRTCVRTTHDSSCLNGEQVWDMVNGVRLRTFAGVTWYAWVPGQPHTLAHIEPNGWPRKLFFWNLETGAKEFPSACPDWIRTDKVAAFDARDLIAFCEDPLVPTVTPITRPSEALVATPVVTVTLTLRPLEDFVLKAYSNLVATYDTSKWEWHFNSTPSPTGASFENVLYSRQLMSCIIQEQGATEIGSPASPPPEPYRVRLGQITYDVYRFDRPDSGLNMAWYVDRNSLKEYSYADGLPIFIVSSASDQWQECESECIAHPDLRRNGVEIN